MDEFEALHSAWLVWIGEAPYFDFFQHHHPLLYYVLAPLVPTLGEDPTTLFAARGLVFLFKLGILALTWNLARRLFERWVAHAAVVMLLACMVFAEKAIEVRPDVPMTLAGMASVYFLVRHGESRRRAHLVASAVSAGLAFLFLQKAVFVIAGMALVGVVRCLRREATWADFALYATVFLGVLAPMAGWLLWHDGFATYLFLNWGLNLPTEGTFGPSQGLEVTFARNGVLWIFFLLAWPALETARQRELPFLALAALALVFTAHRPWPQYYMMAMPLVAVVAAASIRHALPTRPLFSLALVFLGCALPVYRWTLLTLRTNEGQVEQIAYVLAATDEDDYVHDGRPDFNLFRRDIDWFWFSLGPEQCLARYRHRREYSYDPVARIAELRPKIITSWGIDDFDDPRIANHYVPVKEHKGLYVRRDGPETRP